MGDIMELDCICNNGIASDGNQCPLCGGDGIILLSDQAFGRCSISPGVKGIIWNAILVLLTDISGYLTGGVKNRLTRIETKVDEIKAVVDAL